MEKDTVRLSDYQVEQAWGAQSGGDWVVWRVCRSCKTRVIVARFADKADAKVWAAMKANPDAVVFADGIAEDWYRAKEGTECLTA